MNRRLRIPDRQICTLILALLLTLLSTGLPASARSIWNWVSNPTVPNSEHCTH